MRDTTSTVAHRHMCDVLFWFFLDGGELLRMSGKNKVKTRIFAQPEDS